jgi:hypothetical protein
MNVIAWTAARGPARARLWMTSGAAEPGPMT